MRIHTNFCCIVALFFCAVPLLAGEKNGRIKYVVKRGDTLSDIVWDHVPGRLYGKKGNLARVLAMNPALRGRDRVRTGETIFLPGPATAVGHPSNGGAESESKHRGVAIPTPPGEPEAPAAGNL